MRNSSSLDWLRFMHTPNDYRVSQENPSGFYVDPIYDFYKHKQKTSTNILQRFLVIATGFKPVTG